MNMNRVKDLATIFDPQSCFRKGKCPVTQIRKQGDDPFESHSLYFEQHGTGPEKVLFIMGLNSTSFSWFNQVKYFASRSQYSLLVFDNRGVGHSGVPRGPYTTSGMAKDVVVLLDYMGWIGKRQLHVVGISLGGMIAQELATRIPERIASLTLGVTTPGGRPWTNLPPFRGASSLVRLMTISDKEVKIPIILDMMYSSPWLEEKAEGDPAGRTNREVQAEAYQRRMAITPPQTVSGAVSQMSAGMTHRVKKERLRTISASIPKVLIVTGDQDHLVDPRNSRYMKTCMPEAELVEWKGTGHGIHTQRAEWFNSLLERVFKEGREKSMNEM